MPAVHEISPSQSDPPMSQRVAVRPLTAHQALKALRRCARVFFPNAMVMRNKLDTGEEYVHLFNPDDGPWVCSLSLNLMPTGRDEGPAWWAKDDSDTPCADYDPRKGVVSGDTLAEVAVLLAERFAQAYQRRRLLAEAV